MNKADNYGRDKLHQAVIDQDLSEAINLLNSGVEINLQDENGWTPLHFACQNYDLEIAKLLIKYGAEIDIKDNNGNTPLFRATFECKNNSGNLIEFFLRKGADPDQTNDYGVSPKMLAERIGNYDVLQNFKLKNE